MTLKASLWEGGGPKGRRERAYDLAADKGNVSPSVRFADSAPLLALRATSPVSGESVSQREPFMRDVGAHSVRPRADDEHRPLQVCAKVYRHSFSQVVMSKVVPGSTSMGTVSALRKRHFLAKPSAFRSRAQMRRYRRLRPSPSASFWA